MIEPKIWAFTMTYWNSQKHAESLEPELRSVMERVQLYFKPRKFFLASGTWSEPNWSPLNMRVPVINSGIVLTKPYEARRWAYAGCALTAALGYALSSDDWNLLVTLDTDVLVGAVDFDSILREFLSRPEELVGLKWQGNLGMILAWKRSGAARWMNQRKRANLVEDDEPEPMWMEEEFEAIHRGRWWNPWPHIESTRQDGNAGLNEQALTWPFVRCPHASIIEQYTREQTSLAKPVQSA